MKVKKRNILLLVFAIILLIIAAIMIFLGANNLRMPWESAPTSSPTVTPVVTIQPTPVKSEAPPVTTPPPYRDAKYFAPSNAQMDENYKRADEIFSWFKSSALPTDSAVKQKYNGSTYFKVNYPGIEKLADLENAAGQMFTAAIVSSLIIEAVPKQYLEISGVLYAQPADKGADLTRGKQNFSVIRNGDFAIVYRVETEILDPAKKSVVKIEKDDFNFEYKQNGKWLFSNFYLI